MKRENIAMIVAARLSEAADGEEPVTLSGFDGQTYSATLPNGTSVSLPQSSVWLPVGTAGLVHGLQGAPQHNGKAGCVMKHDIKAGRYLVAIDAATSLRLKLDNFRA